MIDTFLAGRAPPLILHSIALEAFHPVTTIAPVDRVVAATLEDTHTAAIGEGRTGGKVLISTVV